MPELPEVEHAARSLRAWMQGRCIVRAAAERGRVLRDEDPRRFARVLSGRTLESVERRGKYLLLIFDREVGLLSHLGMTGKLVLREAGEVEPYSRARFELQGGQVVHFRDPRKFGRLRLAPARRLAQQPEIAALGPDAWEEPPTLRSLSESLGRTKRPVKLALMDQSVIAGLGNIQVAEALFRAHVSPRRRADQLRPEELGRLATAIRESLAFTLARLTPVQGDVSYVEEPGAANPFLIYGKAGEPCPLCGEKLRSFSQGGRTTHWCPRCQR
ncbi:MAG: bifunctional DNA-formamidopyrimidine glycosylase/DNA-(apurinic or apyrimidinic site) lyase [Deltaproteobacteria bacterium]|nr:bifunctional DNA-formamidopyrimidine glycosylase/DNA-(apurinic or apyrimidinic site) lyase [Deltaproteobacteria bacterium]